MLIFDIFIVSTIWSSSFTYSRLMARRHKHTPKTAEVEANTGIEVVAIRRQHIVATAEVPRTATQHPLRITRSRSVLTPLPDIAAQIINAEVV